MVDMARLRRRYRRLTTHLILAAAAVVVVVLVGFAALSAASHAAPPPVEHRPVDVDAADPGEVAYTAANNLRATEYRYHLVVARAEGGKPLRTVASQHATIDNRARVLRSQNRDGAAIADRSIPPVRYYANAAGGYQRTPAGFRPSYFAPRSDGSWRYDRDLAFHAGRNAFDEVERLRDAPATLVAANDSVVVVRVDDAVVATNVTDRRSSYRAANATANLTFVVDATDGRLEQAVFRYHDRADDVRVRVSYQFEDYGRVSVTRPLGTLPGQPAEPFFRADLGLRAVFDADGVTADG